MQQLYKQYKKSNRNSIEFFLSIAKQRAVGFIPAQSLAFLQGKKNNSPLILEKKDRFKELAINTCQGSTKSLPTVNVMNIEQDYSYYQPWSDNEWLVDEMIAM